MSRLEQLDIPRYTISDYRLWKGDWELISGHPIAMSPSPMITHQSVCGNIHFELKDELKECEDCQVLYEIDWIIDEENILRPDIVVVCESADEEYVTKAPKVIFEVISKSTAHNDRVIKKQVYQEEGVLYYGIVDPEVRLAKIYKLQDGAYIKLIDATKEKVEFEFDGCKVVIDFSKIWRK
ncbi:MAG: Uma2 family endonuclease [Campylobacterales bacterium]